MIQFYFNGKGQFTKANVKSQLTENDEALRNMVEQLKE